MALYHPEPYWNEDTLRLIFLRGADASDPKGPLTGNFKDKRKMASFQNIEQVKKAEPDLVRIIKDLIKKLE